MVKKYKVRFNRARLKKAKKLSKLCKKDFRDVKRKKVAFDKANRKWGKDLKRLGNTAGVR